MIQPEACSALLPEHNWKRNLKLIIKVRLLVKNISKKANDCPVDNLQKRDDAESKTEAKKSSKGGDEVHRPNPNAPLQLCG